MHPDDSMAAPQIAATPTILTYFLMILSFCFILVDDIITTGATINEAGRILKQAGAKRLYALAAAIAE